MTTDQTIHWDDTILPFQLDRANIRGRVARLDGMLDQVLRQHNYPAEIDYLVAEATVLTALIGQTIDLRWKLSLQIRGDGPCRIIATDYFGSSKDGAPASIRAYASFDRELMASGPGSPFEKIGKGMFAILIDQGQGKQPYQGITPLAGGSLSACAETYFAQSEQLPTRFSLSMGKSQIPGGKESWRAGGVMLQHLPKASPHIEEASGEGGLLTATDVLHDDDAENWNRANLLLDTVEDLELIGPHVTPTTLLRRLFHEEAPRIHPAQTVKFGCTCSPDKVKQAMSIYSKKDMAHMTNDQGQVTADCQFCGKHYKFAPEELGQNAQIE